MFRNVLVVGLGLGLGVAHAGVSVSVRPALTTATVKAGVRGVGIVSWDETGPNIRQVVPVVQAGPKVSGR